MESTEAAKIINNLVFMPGWTFEAAPMDAEECSLEGIPFVGNPVRVTHVIKTHNSNRECARDGYRDEITIAPTMAFPAEAMESRDDVMAYIYAACNDVFQHEAREFLRDPARDYAAPFHPHRPEGVKLFDSYFTA